MTSDISAIVPMYNAASTIERCLAPLIDMKSRGELKEIIVVDDCSNDRSPTIVAALPSVRLERTQARGGPGAARNHAADFASGTYLWFVDSDVIVAADSARVLARAFVETGAGAVFGCYDDSPEAVNFLSQYKNLVHRYYHVRGNGDASTFWAGCGAVDRALFDALGGFDAKRYRHPSVEDIELGYRIIDLGRRIVIRPDLQGKHLKEWRLPNLFYTEFFRRALPWSRLMLEREHITNALNVDVLERVRALLALGWIAGIGAAAAGFIPTWLPMSILIASAFANRELIRYFDERRGAVFAMRAFLYHQVYYVYSSTAFACATLAHVLRMSRKRSACSV
jgi:glycosyltransferase involved in cell wall biosynthesis